MKRADRNSEERIGSKELATSGHASSGHASREHALKGNGPEKAYMFDAHIHLEQYGMRADGTMDWTYVDRLIETWRSGGVQGVLAVSSDLASSIRTLQLKQRHPDFVRAAIGWHPEYTLNDDKAFLELVQLIRTHRAQLSAIGEIGLPHYANREQYDLMRERLVDWARLSVMLDLPLVLHAVYEGTAEALHVLLTAGVKKAHFHWLKTSPEHLHRVIRSGYMISVTPEVCYRKRDQILVRTVPLTQLLLETDGPWPYDGPFLGIQTTPLFLERASACVGYARLLRQHRRIHEVYQGIEGMLEIEGRSE
ncbi:MAG: TatD family hydrolase [Candidatus Carbobacillus altaicus]|nr:TatD family hydrolase [Candidatus Carbobacillus altaicus]